MHGFRIAQNLKLEFDTSLVLKRLETNLERHRVVVEEALSGYRNRAISALSARLAQFQSGDKANLRFSLEAPVSHIGTYEQVIKMVRACADTKITLTAEQYSAFIEDEWDWSQHWLETNAVYSNTARERR